MAYYENKKKKIHKNGKLLFDKIEYFYDTFYKNKKFQFGNFSMMFPDSSRPFNNVYKCYSVSMFPGNDRQDVEKGGKSKLIMYNYLR